MKLENVKITKVGSTAYLSLKKKLFEQDKLSFDKLYDVELNFKEVEVKPEPVKEEIPLPPEYINSDE